MADKVVEAAASAPANTPAQTPSSEATPAADAPYSPEADFEAGIASLKAARAAAAPPDANDATGAKTATPGAPTDAGVPASAEPAAETSTEPSAGGDDVDAKIARAFNRITAIEQERDKLAARTRELEAAAERAAEYDKAFAEFRTAPEKLFEKVGWDHDTVRDYIENGPKAPSVAEKALNQKQSTIEQKIAELEQKLATAEQQRAEAQFLSVLPSQLQQLADSTPHMHSYYDDPAERAQAVLAVIRTVHSDQGQLITVPEAAQRLENALKAQAQRFARVTQKQPTSPASAAPTQAAQKQPSLTLINSQPGTNSTKTPEELSDEENLEAAVAFLRSTRQ